MPTNRIAGLDGLRAIAALAIVVHHVGFAAGTTFQGALGRYIGRLDVGVPIFFVLSGFLLFTPVAATILDDRPLRPALEYLWRRFMRIYPAFWVALIAIVVFTSEDLGFSGWVTSSLLVHIYWPDHALGPIPQAWSLATEVSFYLALPFVARLLRPWLSSRSPEQRRNSLLVFVGLCYVLPVFFRIAVLGWRNPLADVAVLWLPAMLDYFAIGMALAVLRVAFKSGSVVRVRLDRSAARAGWWWIAAFLLFHFVSQQMSLALGLEVASWPREIGRQFIYGLIGFALLFPLVFGQNRGGWTRQFVASRPVDWLGKISYSIYLWHMVFIVHPWTPMTNILGDVPQFESSFWRLFIVALLPTLTVASLSYYFVERIGLRFQGWVRRPLHRRAVVEQLIERLAQRWRSAAFALQLGLVAGVGFVFRVAYVILVKRDHTFQTKDIFPGDQFYYSLAADALAEGKGFITPWHMLDATVPAGQAADHPPLTALVAAVASWLSPRQGEHIFEQRFVMCLVGAGVVAMIGLVAHQLAGRAVGLTAALIAAFYPALWINDGLVMSESLLVFLVAGAVWTALRYRQDPHFWQAAQLGAWIGLAALARSESLLLLVVLVAPLMLVCHSRWKARASATLLCGMAAVLIVAPWVVYNLTRFDEPVLMSTNDGITLIGANSPQTYTGGAIGFWSLEYANTLVADIAELQTGDPSVTARIWRGEALSYIEGNLDDLPRVVAARLGRLWSVFRPLQMSELNTGEGREVWASNLAFVGLWMAAPLAVLGWWHLGRGQRCRWPLTILVLHASLVGAMFYGIPRFRVPAEIAVVVFAAVGLHYLSQLHTPDRETKTDLQIQHNN